MDCRMARGYLPTPPSGAVGQGLESPRAHHSRSLELAAGEGKRTIPVDAGPGALRLRVDGEPRRLVHLAALHDEADVLEGADVGERVAGDRDQVGEQALLDPPAVVDAHALLNRVFSAYYRYDPARAGVVGPMSHEHLQTAARVEPDNPRAVAFQGLDLFYSPPAHGGDPAAGLERLRKAVELFESDAEADVLEPAWGRAAAHVWYAQALARQAPERRTEAIASVERALEIAPEFAAARAALADLRQEP